MPTAGKDRTSACIGAIVDAVFAPLANHAILVYVVRADGTLALWPPEAPVMPSFAWCALKRVAGPVPDTPYCIVIEDESKVDVHPLRARPPLRGVPALP
jgi:hypothetical protein